MSPIDELIVSADTAAASLRSKRPTHAEVQEWVSRRGRDVSRPRRRRHRLEPIEYRLSQAELIIMGTALAVLISAITFPLAWVLFSWR